jgi:ATP-dependent exoDNAse (exonuclease V) beta subunit
MSLNSQTLAVTALCRLLADPEAYYRENILGLDHQSSHEDSDYLWPNSSVEAAESPGAHPAPRLTWRPGYPFFDLEPPPRLERKSGLRQTSPRYQKGQMILLPDDECFSEKVTSTASVPRADRLAPDQAGTLFHAVLEAVDPCTPRIEEVLRSQSSRLGLSPGPLESADLAARLETFLNGPLGRAWQASQVDYRELPFRLQLPEPVRLTLTGVIDLFFLSSEGEGWIVDYKLAVGRPGPELTAYEHQLRLYGQALISTGFSGPLQAAIYFAGGARHYIHQVELAQPSPLAPLWPLLEKNFQFLLRTRPLRPNRPAALNIV